MCVYVCVRVMNEFSRAGRVLHRKWQQSTSCSDGNLICRASCPGCYHRPTHANAHKLVRKYMEEQTHAVYTASVQTTTQSISVCHVLSPEPTVNTNSLFSVQLCLGGFLALSLALSLSLSVSLSLSLSVVCIHSFHKPITTDLLINAILNLWYQVKGLWVWTVHSNAQWRLVTAPLLSSVCFRVYIFFFFFAFLKLYSDLVFDLQEHFF